jgi:nucleotide-binding universal stress UspA family protein
VSDRTIILGYDGSPASEKALHKAKDIAHRFEASIHLIHVIDWSPFVFQTHEENENQARERRAQMQGDRENLFPPILEALRAAEIEADAEVRWGHPAEVLADKADELSAFMIVIGRTGQSNLKSLLFGSVASRTVQMADCPVLVVP